MPLSYGTGQLADEVLIVSMTAQQRCAQQCSTTREDSVCVCFADSLWLWTHLCILEWQIMGCLQCFFCTDFPSLFSSSTMAISSVYAIGTTNMVNLCALEKSHEK